MIRHHFHSEVWQPETNPKVSIPSCSDLFSIKFQLFEVTRSSGEDLEESKLVAETQTKQLSRTQLLCLRTRDTWLICTGALLSMGVPHDEHTAIVAKILEALRVAVPFRPICVVIKDIVTVEECNGGDESSNEIRNDSLEAKKHEEEEEEEEECVICLEDLSHFGPKSVTPCSHIYHRDCIREWQKKTEENGHLCLCPMCRRPIASVEMAGEPSTQPSPWSTALSRPPQYQRINEEEEEEEEEDDVVETESLHQVSCCEIAGCTITTLLMIPLCFVMFPCCW